MSSQGLVSTGSGPHEITLTINNSSLSQVLAQAAGPAASASGSPQEITLTISGQCFPGARCPAPAAAVSLVLFPAVSPVRPTLSECV